MSNESKTKVLKRFKLLVGQHIGNDPITGKEKHYFANGAGDGNIIESYVDLCAKFNGGGAAYPKFQQIGLDDQLTKVDPLTARKDGESEAEYAKRMIEYWNGKLTNTISSEEDEDVDEKVAAELAKTEREELEKKLSSMSISELKQYASSEDIDLKGVAKKDDMIKLIMSAFSTPVLA